MLMAKEDQTKGKKPKEEGLSQIYGAVYSGVPVFEMMCRNVAVMRRRSDSYLNATQILKVAGIDKGRRTKILEKEILNGEHEKVQGGYGKYQGTWIPFDRGFQLAQQYQVDQYLRPLFEFDPPKAVAGAPTVPTAPKKPSRRQSMESPVSKRARKSLKESPAEPSKTPSPIISPTSPQPKRVHCFSTGNPVFMPSYDQISMERNRTVLMSIFLYEDPHYIPDVLKQPQDLDVNVVIDDQGHTAVHWAAALARLNVLRALIDRGALISKLNSNGESALSRSVLVTNNFDHQSFPELLELLSDTVAIVDKNNRSVLHHICLTAGIKGRSHAARYYMECLLDHIGRFHEGDFNSIIDLQDKNGDTALTIAARVGNRHLVEQLLDVGANSLICNHAGLKLSDYGFLEQGHEMLNEKEMDASNSISSRQRTDQDMEVVYPTIRTRVDEGIEEPRLQDSAATSKGRELATAVSQLVEEMTVVYSQELKSKQEQLTETHAQLRDITRELAEIRRQNLLLKQQNNRLPELLHRIHNLEQYLNEELAKNPSMIQLPDPAPDTNYESKSKNELLQECLHLRQMVVSREAVESQLRNEIIQLRAESGSQELHCKKIIAACCNVPIESVQGLIGPLLNAIESDEDPMDMSQVAAFMSRVKQQESGYL